jgi:FAD/FMN-containing dehydrogenase
VGNGIVVDVSKYFTKIVAFDPIKKTVTVQPGVIRELNLYLKPHGVFFGPNTSTSSRMIGGWWGIIPQVLPRFAMALGIK